jgi:branched-chain amino acid transport system ATP-binding protein
MSTPLLAIRGLRTAYGKILALKGVDLDVNDGEIVALIGANGAGKSTLMMSVFGRPRPEAGQILYDGNDITQVPTHHIARLRIAQSPEGRRIFARMSVLENLQMGADATNEPKSGENLDRVLTLFPRLKERLTQRGGTLSGGEQQMLAIGRALMSRPRLLLLDEPSLGLAPLITRQIFDAIRTLNRRETCAAPRPSRLRHGQWRDHTERFRQRTVAASGNPRGLSRGRPTLISSMTSSASTSRKRCSR